MENGDIGFAILELMGHRKLAGYVREVEIAGGKILRVDVPAEGCTGPAGPFQATQFYGGSALYCLTPCDAGVAIRFAAGCKVEPVTRWDLPALSEPRRRAADDEADDIPFETSIRFGDDDE